MPMVVVVTRSAPDRTRGFLGSLMLELSPGVYAHPRMSAAVRTRIWNVISEWFQVGVSGGSIVMSWADTAANGGMGLRILGEPPKDLVLHDSMILVRRNLGVQNGPAAVKI